MAAAVEGAGRCRYRTTYRITLLYTTDSRSDFQEHDRYIWHGLNAIKSGASRPTAVAKMASEESRYLGAGMMGAGIAYSTAIKAFCHSQRRICRKC